jgi:voltage-gated potassium channel
VAAEELTRPLEVQERCVPVLQVHERGVPELAAGAAHTLRDMASPDLAAEPRIAAWNRRVDWWLTGLAAVFLAAYAWQVLDTSLTPAGRNALEVALTATWVLFGVDYLVRIALARNRWRFVYTHLLDLVILALPMFRQLRVLRLITVITVLNRQLRDDVRGRVVFYVVGTVVLIGFVASLAVLDAERYAPDASITTFGGAVWWTITTISTVGYGDHYPVTPEGRLVAASLMVAGIALLGVVTASIASWFVENLRRSGAVVERELDEVSADVNRAEVQLAAVLAELRAINARLDELERSSRPS